MIGVGSGGVAGGGGGGSGGEAGEAGGTGCGIEGVAGVGGGLSGGGGLLTTGLSGRETCCGAGSGAVCAGEGEGPCKHEQHSPKEVDNQKRNLASAPTGASISH